MQSRTANFKIETATDSKQDVEITTLINSLNNLVIPPSANWATETASQNVNMGLNDITNATNIYALSLNVNGAILSTLTGRFRCNLPFICAGDIVAQNYGTEGSFYNNGLDAFICNRTLTVNKTANLISSDTNASISGMNTIACNQLTVGGLSTIANGFGTAGQILTTNGADISWIDANQTGGGDASTWASFIASENIRLNSHDVIGATNINTTNIICDNIKLNSGGVVGVSMYAQGHQLTVEASDGMFFMGSVNATDFLQGDTIWSNKDAYFGTTNNGVSSVLHVKTDVNKIVSETNASIEGINEIKCKTLILGTFGDTTAQISLYGDMWIEGDTTIRKNLHANDLIATGIIQSTGDAYFGVLNNNSCVLNVYKDTNVITSETNASISGINEITCNAVNPTIINLGANKEIRIEAQGSQFTVNGYGYFTNYIASGEEITAPIGTYNKAYLGTENIAYPATLLVDGTTNTITSNRNASISGINEITCNKLNYTTLSPAVASVAQITALQSEVSALQAEVSALQLLFSTFQQSLV